MASTINYLTDIAILLAAAVIAVPIFQSLRMGAVPGFVIAGVIVGPHGLALIGNVEEIGQFAELGIVLLLFVIGIELNPKRLWMMRRLLFGLGALQVLLTSIVFVLAIRHGLGIPLRIAVLIGPAMALSSTAFVLQLLTEHKMLTSEPGRASIAVLLLQDLAVVPLLALVSLLAMPTLTLAEDLVLALGEAAIIIVLVILFGRYLLQPVLHRVAKSHNLEVFTASAVLLVLGAAVLMEHVGLSMAMGAFLAGLLIADSSFRHQVIAETQPFRGLLLGLFFMSMGMTLDLPQFLHHPVLFLGLVAALIFAKAIVILPLAIFFGLAGKSAVSAALLLAQSGEFALVVFTVALGAGLMDETLFQQLILVVILSMLATPLLARLARKIEEMDHQGQADVESRATTEEVVLKPVIIIGFGRVGRKVGRILEMAKAPFSAIDNNPTLVSREHALGRPVFFGDAERPSVLKAMGVEEAHTAIIALDNQEVTEQLVSTLRENFPSLVIYALGRNRTHCERLRALGADMVVSETLEASLELARVALTNARVPEGDASRFVESFRQNYYEKHNLMDD